MGVIDLYVQLRNVVIGKVKFVVLDNLNTEVIIGNDVLSKLFDGIDFKKNQLTFNNHLIDLNACNTGNIAGVYEVYVLHGISVPPFGEVITTDTTIRGKLNVYSDDADHKDRCFLVEPVQIAELQEKILVARAVYSIDQLINGDEHERIPIRLANFTDRTINVSAGSQLATIQSIEVDSIVSSNELVGATTITEVNDESSPLIIGDVNAVTTRTTVACIPAIEPEQVIKAIKTTNVFEVEQLKQLLLKYPQLFAANPKKPTQTTRTTHAIDTGAAEPIKLHPYRNARVDDEFIEKEITQLLDNGLIQRSNSPWAAPVVIVMKKGGDRRQCIDFRKLNNVTKKCSYPLPRVEDLIDSLGTKSGKKKYYSKLDLASAYWSVKMDEKDREKTAFVTKQGLFEWLVMPFGLCNAPATFQRLMDEVLAELKFKCVVVYFDDIVIFSDSFDEHIIHLEQVFKKLTEANLQAKLSKSEFGLKEVGFLGFIIGADGMKPDPTTIQAVSDFRVPQSVKEVRSFIGLCSFYRTFIRGFAAIANPLHHLTKKDIEFVWSSDAQSAFTKLKKALTTAPILASPEFGKPFILTTDASKFALGAVLSQVQEGKERAIRYASRSMNAAERNYSVTEKECLAIVWAIGMYRCYLLGTTFTIITDHKPLVQLPSLKLDDPYGRLARWTLKLQHYNYNVIYKKGELNTNADALSRMVDYEITDVDESKYDSEVEETNEEAECKEGGNSVNNVDIFTTTNIKLKEIEDKQNSDPVLKPLIDYLAKGELPTDTNATSVVLSQARKDFELVDGVLFHFWYPSINRTNKNWKKQLCVPKSMQPDFLIQYHDAMGHMGIRKTYDKLASSLYWKTMHADVENWIKSCTKCNGKKDPKTGKQFPIGTIVPSGEACSEWVVDVLGPLKPTTRNGNKYVVIFIDRMTKWPEAFAVPNQDSETIARLLVQEIIPRHGCPRTLLSDRGSPFLSKLSTAVYELLGIKKLNTTAYHPQCNGLVERFNHTIVSMIAMYTNEYPDDWDEHLNYCIWAYRTSVNDTTKFSPFYLMYGRDPLFPIDAMLESEETYRSSEEYVSEIIRKINVAKEMVKNKVMQIKQKRDETNSQLNRIQMFNVGEYVMLYNPRTKKGVSSKLSHKWKGPYSIVARTSPVNYIIKNVETKKTDHVHVSRLKSCYRREVNADGVTFESEMKVDPTKTTPTTKVRRSQRVTNTSTTTTSSNSQDAEATAAPEYEVEKIVGKGWDEITPGNWTARYKVRWKGYTPAADTWETLDNLIGSEELIEIYDALHANDEETYTDAETNMISIPLF